MLAVKDVRGAIQAWEVVHASVILPEITIVVLQLFVHFAEAQVKSCFQQRIYFIAPQH